MITWEQVVPAASISGEPVGYSSGLTDAAASYTDGTTKDWFNGEIASAFTRSVTDFGVLFEDFDEISIDENGTTFTFRYDTQGIYSNGEGTTSGVSFDFTAEVGSGNFGGYTDVGEPNTDWSRQSVDLASYEETVLVNQTGITTTATAAVETVRTTQLVDERVETIASEVPISRTTTTQVSTFSINSWTRNTYATVFVTGETTAKFFSAFSNEVPAVFDNGIVTTASIIEPLSFVEVGGFATTQDVSVTSVELGDFGSSAWTTQTAGTSVQNSINPQTTVGGQRAATATRFIIVQQTAEEEVESQFATVEVSAKIGTTLQMPFGDSTVAVQYVSTTEINQTAQGYLTGETLGDLTRTQSGEGAIANTNFFTTSRQAEIIGATQATVGVRAKSNGAVGGGIQSIAIGVPFYLHTTSVVLPASTVFTRSDTTFTFSGDSYTARDTSGGTTQSEFDVTGDSQTQFMLLAPVFSAATRATVLGGRIRGNAIVVNGHYETFAGGSQGTSEVTEPLAVTWEANAATTAWLPSMSVETVGESATAVLAISRHSFTEVIDD